MTDKNKVEEPVAVYGQPLNFEKVWFMFKETDKMFKETAESIKDTGRQIKELSKNLGGIGNSNGYYAEQFFFTALDKQMKLVDIQLEYIEHNKQRYIKRLKLREEYDAILTNSDIQVIVEIKFRFKEEHLRILLDRKIPNYRILFPENKHYKLRVAIAAFSFEEGVMELAKQHGCYILTRAGEDFEVLYSDAIKEY